MILGYDEYSHKLSHTYYDIDPRFSEIIIPNTRISLDLYGCTAVQLYTVPLYSCDLEFTLLLRSW